MEQIKRIIAVLFCLLFANSVYADITDGKYSTAQIFDVQWYISGGVLHTSGYNYIYASVNYATQTNSAARLTAAQYADINSNGRYIAFFNSTTKPGTYGLAVYNSDGTQYKILNNTGTFKALADGAIFYNGNGMWGTLFTTKQGYNIGDSGNFTVSVQNPSSSDLQSYTPESTTPLAAGETAASSPGTSPGPTAIYNNSANVYITNHYPTSNNSAFGEGAANAFDNNPNTKYLNFDKYNAGVTVKLNAGRIVTGFTLTTANDFPGRDPTSYKLYASNDGSNWTLIGEGSLSLSNDRFWTSDMIAVNNSTSYVYYYIFFPTTKAGEGCGYDCNSMQIAEITYYYDVNDTTTSNDIGTGSVANPSDYCCGGSADPFNANAAFSARASNFINGPSKSTLYIEQIGNNNSAVITQLGERNYADTRVNGSFNSVTINQSSTQSTQANYLESYVTGSNNTQSLTQNSTGGGKGILVNATGNANSITVNQTDDGNHYAEINLADGNKTVNITQQGSAAHMAKIELSGGETAINTTQTGSTQQYYSITHNCANISCSAITVTQGQ